jgi:pyruvate/2-oxoglutarate dehydrogenase complex dihydrolipoamide dehydrogenase (E3) component
MGKKIKVANNPKTRVARALEQDQTRGKKKALDDNGTDEIIGFTLLGLEGGEIMSTVQMAMQVFQNRLNLSNPNSFSLLKPGRVEMDDT